MPLVRFPIAWGGNRVEKKLDPLFWQQLPTILGFKDISRRFYCWPIELLSRGIESKWSKGLRAIFLTSNSPCLFDYLLVAHQLFQLLKVVAFLICLASKWDWHSQLDCYRVQPITTITHLSIAAIINGGRQNVKHAITEPVYYLLLCNEVWNFKLSPLFHANQTNSESMTSSIGNRNSHTTTTVKKLRCLANERRQQKDVYFLSNCIVEESIIPFGGITTSQR